MAGHSQFKNIMHRKGAKDAKKAKIFTKITREIIVAAKSGSPDPNANSRLRAAVLWAREENMPRDRIEGAIKRATSAGEGDQYDPVRYEGYGPGGTALIVEALTDNRNRTAADVRAAFTKHGGNMGESGSVSFMFTRAGVISYPAAVATEEAMLEAAIEAGADNCESSPEGHVVTCAVEAIGEVRDALQKKLGEPESAKIRWLPNNTVAVNEEQGRSLLKLIDVLEDNDDVQEVFSNFDLSEDLMSKLAS